jgi:RND family efflux transporter MFP subunit
MDRVNVDELSPSASAGPIADPQQSAWQAFTNATTPDAFYRSWLALQCRQIHGVQMGVVVLQADDGKQYAPAAFWPEGGRNAQHLAEVSERALTEQRGLVIPRTPRRQSDGTARARYDVAYPIQVDGHLHGVVAIDVLPRQERDLQSVLRQLQWGTAWLEVIVLRQGQGGATVVAQRLQTVVDLMATAFGHARFSEAATAFATAAATKLNCDRVSVGFIAGGRARTRAMSHTAQFGKQTNVVRAIESAMDEAIDQAAVVVAPTAADAPHVNRMHTELSRQHGAPAVCTAPFAYAGEIIGAITLERPAPFDRDARDLVEALGGLGGPVLELTRREDRSLASKARDAARDALGAIIGPRHLGLKLGLVAALIAVAILAKAEGDFRIAGMATIEPVVRRAAVAPFNGYIAEAPARAGDVVRRGQLLVKLDDRDIQLERLKWTSQLEQLSRQHGQALATRNSAQVVIVSAQLDQARAQVALLDDQLARMRITAPFDGIVVVGDLSQSLASPVERGQVLYEIAPLDAYRLIVQVDERDVASVAPGQHGTLVLTGAPGSHLRFTVEKVTPVSTAKESRNYFRVEAKLDQGLDRLRPGMEGIGKVDVDRRLWAWIWTRQIIDWARLQLWTWLP